MSESCSIKIITKKYGELYFSKITGNLSDIVEKADNENIIPILMKESYSEELNTNFKKEDIDFYSFSEDEQNDFYEKFLSMQFQDYKSLSKCESVQKAIEKASIFKAACSPAIESAMKSMQVFKAACKPIIGNEMESIQKLISATSPLHNLQMPESLSRITKFAEKMNKLAAIPSTNFFVEKHYSSLFKALESFNKLQGNYIARINEPGKTLSTQLGMLTNLGWVSKEVEHTALSYIPDFTISAICRDENNNIDVYAKNPDKRDGVECNIKSTVDICRRFMETLNISRDEAMDFLGYLQEYPYLALADNVGKKIFKAVKTEIGKYTITEKNNILYHARGKKKGRQDFTPLQMREVQYGRAGMGRYNFLGQPRYYLATEIETAKKEVECDEFPESTVMKLQQIQEMNVFDISSEDCPLASFCNMPKEDGNDYTAYLIPNFFSVCCAYLNKNTRHSVDAIKYKSNKDEKGYCYVILDKAPLEFFDDGEIVLPNDNN